MKTSHMVLYTQLEFVVREKELKRNGFPELVFPTRVALWTKHGAETLGERVKRHKDIAVREKDCGDFITWEWRGCRRIRGFAHFDEFVSLRCNWGVWWPARMARVYHSHTDAPYLFRAECSRGSQPTLAQISHLDKEALKQWLDLNCNEDSIPPCE